MAHGVGGGCGVGGVVLPNSIAFRCEKGKAIFFSVSAVSNDMITPSYTLHTIHTTRLEVSKTIPTRAQSLNLLATLSLRPPQARPLARPMSTHASRTQFSHLRAASGMRIGSGIRRSLRQRCCSLPKDLTPNRGDGSALPRCAALRLPQSISSNERVHHIHYERSHKQMQACAKRRAALRTWEVHGCVLAVAVR